MRKLDIRSVAIAGTVFLAILPSGALGQQSAVVVSIVDSLSGQRIANADIADLRSGARTRSSATGHARLIWPADGNLSIRVRQIGYVAATRDLSRDMSADSVTIAMSKVLYLLPPVRTSEASACTAPADPASAQLSAMALEQIRHSAERYEAFRRDYPFRAIVKRRTATVGPDGKITRVETSGEVRSESWGDKYRPGQVVRSTAFGFTVPLLFLGALAEPEFWRNHCFAANGVETHSGARLLRLDFEPARNVRSADWEGSAFIDSATSMLVRVDFRLTGVENDTRVRRLEGYTTFKSPSPFFVMPDSTVAGWWKRAPANGEWGSPDVAQSLHTTSVEYRKKRPPSGN
jgi:hypothetical protein